MSYNMSHVNNSAWSVPPKRLLIRSGRRDSSLSEHGVAPGSRPANDGEWTETDDDRGAGLGEVHINTGIDPVKVAVRPEKPHTLDSGQPTTHEGEGAQNSEGAPSKGAPQHTQEGMKHRHI